MDMSLQPSIGEQAIADALWRKPLTEPEIKRATGLNRLTVSKLLQVMKDRHAIHICEWRLDSNRFWTAVYKLGMGYNQPEPEWSERQKREWNLKKIRARETFERRKERERQRREELERQRQELVTRPAMRDPLVSAFFGQARAACNGGDPWKKVA